MKKNLVALLLALGLVASLAGCSEPTQKPIENSSTPAASETGSGSVESEQGGEEAALPTIESTVLVDQDGIVVTAQELVEDPIWGPGLKLLVENNSDTNQNIFCDYVVVNNFMFDTLLFSADVAAGKKANETLYFSSSTMEGAGITTIGDLSFKFHSSNPETFETIFTTDEVSLATSASGTFEQTIPDEGKELYNENGVRIVGRYVSEDTIWGAGVVLFLENNSGKDIQVSCDNMSINGFMVTPFFSCLVNDGRMAVSNITILSSDLEANGIESVEDIELAFKGFDPNTFSTVFESSPITFSTAA